MAGAGLTHVDASGNARMVDITGKDPSRRRAIAWCRVVMSAGERTGEHPNETATHVVAAALVESARVAGILGAKQTSSLVPLCHPIPIGDVTVEISVEGDAVEIVATATTWARTGIEMEALTACAFAALTLIDGCEHPELAVIDALTLLEKTGGRSGTWTRDAMGSSTESQAPSAEGGSGS